MLRSFAHLTRHAHAQATRATLALTGLTIAGFALTGLAIAGLAATLVLASPTGAAAQTKARAIALDDPAKITAVDAKSEVVTHRGQRALKVSAPDGEPPAAGSLIVITDATFRNGTIEFDAAADFARRPDGTPSGVTFVGAAFRVSPDRKQFEYIYLRPMNGRQEDQLRRNHSTQYSSHPDYGWERLRKETPGKYESYVDLEVGAWTKVKIVVNDSDARLFVHGAAQPTLVVTDLKLKPADGGLALWVGPGTIGYFANLRVTNAPIAVTGKDASR